jgi:hypothetical protein
LPKSISRFSEFLTLFIHLPCLFVPPCALCLLLNCLRLSVYNPFFSESLPYCKVSSSLCASLPLFLNYSQILEFTSSRVREFTSSLCASLPLFLNYSQILEFTSSRVREFTSSLCASLPLFLNYSQILEFTSSRVREFTSSLCASTLFPSSRLSQSAQNLLCYS